VLLACWVFRVPILCGIAGGLIVDDRPVHNRRTPAPAVLILDGDRPFDAAARLYHAEKRTILVYRGRPDRLVRMGIMQPGDETARRELLKLGVASQDLVLLVGDTDSRSGIAAVLGSWLKEHPDQTVNVLCERFTSRTWKIVLSRAAQLELAGKICIVPLKSRQYDESNWWRSKQGTLAFLNNSIILGFHWWRSGDEADLGERTAADFRGAIAGGRK
jgi:hypothetical protein